MKIDLLAFAAHPDDVELSCSGLLMVEKNNGKTTGIIDLTLGELGTRGNPEIRKQESAAAAKILGVDIRQNLQMADGFFNNNHEHQVKVIEAIRKYRPEIIVCNAPADRHPDHGRAARLVADASFLSGLSRIVTMLDNVKQVAWRPKYVLNFIQDRYLKPDFVIDITEVFERKLEAIKAYSSQFYNPAMEGPETYISKPEFLESVIGRYRMFGQMIGVKYAEGYISEKMIGIRTLDALIKENT